MRVNDVPITGPAVEKFRNVIMKTREDLKVLKSRINPSRSFWEFKIRDKYGQKTFSKLQSQASFQEHFNTLIESQKKLISDIEATDEELRKMEGSIESQDPEVLNNVLKKATTVIGNINRTLASM